MSNVPAVQSAGTPDVGGQQWSRSLEEARSLVAMPEGEWRRMWQVSQVLAGSQLVPKVLKDNPQGVMAVGLHCRALQVPFTALSVKTHFHVWEDNRGVVIQPSAQLMLGILHRAGHEAWWGPCDEESATLHVVRAGSTRQQDFTYTVEMAKKADLLKKDNWKNHPGLMCRAGACRMAGRYAAPEALLGLEMFDRLEAVDVPPAAAGPQYEWEGEEVVDAPAFDRPVARLQRQIAALPPWARSELVAAWGERKLPPVSHPDFPACIDVAEDLVDEITARAFGAPAVDQGDPVQVRDVPPAHVRPQEADQGTDHPQPENEPARPLAQQIAIQAQHVGVDHHRVIAAVTNGEKTSAKAVNAEEGQLTLQAIAAIGRGEYTVVEKGGKWVFEDDPGRPFE